MSSQEQNWWLRSKVAGIVLEWARPFLAERIAALARDLPPEVVQQLPPEGAAQHDHYLYGTPKRPE